MSKLWEEKKISGAEAKSHDSLKSETTVSKTQQTKSHKKAKCKHFFPYIVLTFNTKYQQQRVFLICKINSTIIDEKYVTNSNFHNEVLGQKSHLPLSSTENVKPAYQIKPELNAFETMHCFPYKNPKSVQWKTQWVACYMNPWSVQICYHPVWHTRIRNLVVLACKITERFPCNSKCLLSLR